MPSKGEYYYTFYTPAKAKRGGKFAGDTRKRFEEEIGGKVISPLNASDKPALETKKDNDENKD